MKIKLYYNKATSTLSVFEVWISELEVPVRGSLSRAKSQGAGKLKWTRCLLQQQVCVSGVKLTMTDFRMIPAVQLKLTAMVHATRLNWCLSKQVCSDYTPSPRHWFSTISCTCILHTLTSFICWWRRTRTCIYSWLHVCFLSDLSYELHTRGCIPSEDIPADLDSNRCHEIDPFLPFIRRVAAVCLSMHKI